MYNQQEAAGWADGQLNENIERTDDLDGAAEGDNDTSSRISTVVQNQTAPSRPRSRDSYYDRDMRERGEPPEYYGNGRSRNRGHGGGESGPRLRRRNESYRDRDRDGDRSRMEDYDYGYRGGGSRYPAGPMPPDRWYPDPYYGAHMGQGYGAGSSRGAGGYGVQPPGYMSNVKEMLERLRVEDPRRYRQWYEQYQAHRRNPHRVPDPGLPYFGASMGQHPPSTPYGPNYSGWQGGNSSVYAESGTNERQSVHSDVGRPSGRSSVNDEIMKLSMSGIAFNQGLSQTPSINQDPDAGFRSLHEHYHVSPEPRRMTPLKYNTSHCLGVLTPLGHLIKVKNEGATIEIVQVKSLLCHLPEFSKVSAFPGPLKKDTTHKNTLIQFCQKKIKEIRTNEKQADKDNFILLWELLILLLRKNGNVFGSDVSELLLKKNAANSDDTSSAEESHSKNASSDEDEEEESANNVKVEASNCTPINEVKASEKFCEFLLYGHKKEALDYAMNNGLWGHALFLATKMDERTYGSVLARFANCTPFNHPLQTFYQLMSGRQPASAKSCCDDSFGDWRPHLAMILSNAGSRPEVEFNSINRMGDTLGAKGHTFAAQFCYLMSQTEFSSRTKLGPLLGLSSEVDNIIEATQMTEIYEFARSLQDPSFTVGPSFFKSKLNYTKTLLDLGFIEEAFAYCEEIAKKLKMLNNSKGHDDEYEIETVKWSVLQISERLVRCEDSEYEGEPTWIQELRSEISPGKPSSEINSEQRRDSTVLENGTHEVHEALSQQPPYGIEQQQQQQQSSDYGSELKANIMPEPPVQPLNVVDSTNFQPNGPYDIPMYNPGGNQLPPINQQQQPPQPPSGIDQQQQHQHQQQQPQQHPQQQHQQQQQHQLQQQQQPQINMDNGPPHYLQAQTPYGALPNPNMIQDNTTQNQPPPQPSYGSQPPALDNYGGQQQFPEYMSNHNNNYITPGNNGYNTYGQPPPLTDGPPPGSIMGANKKKSVRFEDDEHLEDSDDTSPLGQTLKQIAMRSDEGDKFSFCHPIKASVRNNYVGYKENHSRNLADESRFDYQHERPESAGGEHRLSSDEIMEEIERLTSSGNFNGNFVPTRTTYPIDEPIESLPLNSRPSFLGLKKKTFPIDKHCCNENQLCKDHDNYYHGSTGSGSAASSPPTPSSSHPKIQGSNGSLTGAGSNASFFQGKGMDGPVHKMPPIMNNHKPGPQFQDNLAQNNKTSAGGGKQGNNKAGGGGDGKQPSWFGNILGKLNIRAPNQMILPDDKEPTIVWDPNLKKWVNTKGEEDEDSGPKGPPPSDGDLMRMQQGGVQRPPMMQQPPPMMGGGMPPMMQQPQQNQPPSMMPPHGNFQPNPNNPPNGMPQLGPNVPSYPQTQQQPQAGLPNPQEQQQNFVGYPNQQQQPNQQPNSQVNPGFNNGGPNMNGPSSLPPTGNKYKLPRNRPIRTGYVDVLNPNATSNAPPAGGPMGNGGIGGNMMSPAGGAPGVPNMFIPSPISGSGDSGPVSFLTPAPPGPLPAQSQLEAATN